MKAMARNELLELILVGLIIFVVISVASSIYEKRNSTSESFNMLVRYTQDFINNEDVIETPDFVVSHPMPYYINQGFFMMVCEKNTLCICGKDKCSKSDPMSKHGFGDYEIEVIGNLKLDDGSYAITGDISWLPTGHRRVQNVVFKKEKKDSKKITLIDCSVPEWKKSKECLGEIKAAS